MKPETGASCGSYVLDRKIGSGTFGEVWTARHREWDDRVEAIKFSSDPRFLDKIRAEGDLLHTLEHPNIVRIHDIDTRADPPWLRMEYVPGESLEDRLAREGKIPLPEAERILGAVLDGLAHAHAHRVIHRDLKPSNVLLGENGDVKIADFGLAARVEEDPEALALSFEAEKTSDAPLAGTLDYLAPEQKRGAPPTPASDVYALGLLFYRMVAGRLPAGLKPPSAWRPDALPRHDAFASGALDAAETRYADANEAREAWNRLASPPPGKKSPSRSEADQAGTRARSPWAERWYPLGEGVYLLFVVLTAAVLANVRAVASPLGVALLAVSALGALLGARLARRPLLSAGFWGGLVFAFMGARLFGPLLWIGIAAASASAIVWLAKLAAKDG